MDGVEADPTAPSVKPRALSQSDLELIFKLATTSFVRRYGDQFAKGMSDGDLWRALQDSLGIFGGSGGPDRPSIAYQGSQLKIWGGWRTVNHVQDNPLFQRHGTLAMARSVYGIKDPSRDQLDLF